MEDTRQYTSGERKEDRPDRAVPELPPKLQKILDQILDEDRAIFEALARL